MQGPQASSITQSAYCPLGSPNSQSWQRTLAQKGSENTGGSSVLHRRGSGDCRDITCPRACSLPPAPARSRRQASGHCSHQAPLLSLLGCSAGQKPKQGLGATVTCWSFSQELTPCSPAELCIQKHHMGHWNRPRYKYLHHRNGQTLQLRAPQYREPLLSLYTALAVLLDHSQPLLVGAPSGSHNPPPLPSPAG